MKIIVTHSSPDMDAITSVWLIKKFLPGWESARVEFVPAGERLKGAEVAPAEQGSPRPLNDSSNPNLKQSVNLARANVSGHVSEYSLFKSSFRGGARPLSTRRYTLDAIEKIGDSEVIHVDTGLGPLDHHQTASDRVCAASLTFDYVKKVESSEKWNDRMKAVGRMVKVVVDIDHFKEVFRKEALADYHEFDLASILDGLKLQKPNLDEFYVEFISDCLDAILHEFENRVWAEEEIKNNGVKFNTRHGLGIGFETINDSVIKLAQKMGYVIAVRKDPRKGYVRVKARPSRKLKVEKGKWKNKEKNSQPSQTWSQLLPLNSQLDDIDLTLAYEKLKKMDPGATWFLHISKKMLLNGSVKNPKMRPTKLKIDEIIRVLEKI